MTLDPILVSDAVGRFSEEARQAVYDVIALRRDVRHFDPSRDVDEPTLLRILGAAHLAPSVGFSQPWGFVVVRDAAVRARIRESFLVCRETESARFPVRRRQTYLALRLEGIVEAPANVCVAVDLRPRGEAILGTTVQPEAVRASACCAVQNLWLAARAEGIGVGWVSIVEPAVLRKELALPAGVEPIAYLCVGHPRAFRGKPMLEEKKWLVRRDMADVVHRERWIETTTTTNACPGAAAVQSTGRACAYDEQAREAARAHQRELTKPAGSLGRLEEIAPWYAGARGRFPVEAPDKAALAVFAADHGVVVESVSAYPSSVTAAMVCNVMAGGAAINVLARAHDVDLVIVDVGVAGDLSAAPIAPRVPLVRARVRGGTGNIRVEPAMTRDEAMRAIGAGARVADDFVRRGVDAVGIGEIGIGNTTAAAAVVAALAGAAAEDVVGHGTGLDSAARARKVRVVEDALARHGSSRDAIDVAASLGGLEIAAMAGFALRAASHRVPVVLDGFVAGAAALVANAIEPGFARFALASHASAERGARIVLDALGLQPLFDLGMRLGEGTGAVLGIALLRSAVALQREMATFATAGVVR